MFLVKLLNFLFTSKNIIQSNLRICLIQLRGAKIGNNVKAFGKFTILGEPSNLEIGDFSTLNEGVILNCRNKIYIGKYVHISPYVQIHTGGLNLAIFPRTHYSKPVIIEDNVWLASGVIVNPGAKIGKNSVVLPGAVVVGEIPPNVVVGGIPAKVIKYLK